ncbi:hypothetical protein VNO77_01471 [Canavalia gladiata]|uniref:Uncharacterized protein n=1 Tax=Canavalia gladiata TaxID=3824 RepID=A0AAN9R268_CANGL
MVTQTTKPTSSFLLMVAILILCFVSSKAKLQNLQHPPKADGSLSFLVVGDWGRTGQYNQFLVASQECMIQPLKNHSPKSTQHLACRRNGTTWNG